MTIDVFHTPMAAITYTTLKESLVVVVDVLRATTTIITALELGAKEIVPAYSTEEALIAKDTLKHEHPIVVGEVQCQKPEGFTLNNSPTDLKDYGCRGATIILSTTNGTKIIERSRMAAVQLIGCFSNLSATVNYAKYRAEKDSLKRIVLWCAGSNGSLSLEDSLFAGAFVESYIARDSMVELTDSAIAARCIEQTYRENIQSFLRDSRHAKLLMSLGFGADVEFSMTRDTSSIIGIGSQLGSISAYTV